MMINRLQLPGSGHLNHQALRMNLIKSDYFRLWCVAARVDYRLQEQRPPSCSIAKNQEWKASRNYGSMSLLS